MNQSRATVIIFDLHEVLVSMDYRAIACKLFKMWYRIDVIFSILRPSNIYRFFSLYKKSKVPEQYILTFGAHSFCIKQLTPFFISLLNVQNRITETIELAKKLKSSGYTLCLFSNIGERTYIDFKSKYEDIVSIFDYIVYATAQDNWLQKPQLGAYKKFLTRTGKKPSECLFIDNSVQNIKSAKSCGFKTILFKSPKQITKELINRGYFLTK